MADNTLFAATRNHLGISDASWNACYSSYSSCGEPLGACTAVSGGADGASPYDQFASFRSTVGAQDTLQAGSTCAHGAMMSRQNHPRA